MIAAGEGSSLARIATPLHAARLLAGVCALALAPAMAQQPPAPPAARAAPAKPKTPATKPESAKPQSAKPTNAKPANAKPTNAKPTQQQPAAPATGEKPRTSAPGSAPTAPSAAPPDVSAQPRAFPPLPPLDTSVPPPMLPRASRARMRACADEWDRMKRKSIAGLPTWREFATGCLTRPAAAEQKPAGAAPP